MIFYLGTHMPAWLERVDDVPLFISRRKLVGRATLPRARCRWVLDSGGFTELHHGRYPFTVAEYALEVRRLSDEVGGLDWVAPMDYMCEPSALAATGLSVREHQDRTVDNFVSLRGELDAYGLGELPRPILQGWDIRDYHRHVDLYTRSGVDLAAAPVVGVGSICRVAQDVEIARIVRSLLPLRLHAFGVRGLALSWLAPVLASADSLAWSMRGRYMRLPGHRHKHCGNCLTYALRWRDERLRDVNDQQRLGV